MKITESIIKKLGEILLYNRDDSHEFRPILAEIEERPMNPLGPAVFWIIIIFMVISGLWLYIGKVDVVITARGLVIPEGEVKVIQSLDKGVLRELRVKEGDQVKVGDILALVSPAEHEPGLELANLREEERMQREQLAQVQGKLKYANARKSRLSGVADIIPRAEYEQAMEESLVLSHEASRLSISLSEIANKRRQLEKQTQILTSPINGYVDKVYIHTIGGVVSPAEKIITIVPENAKLQIKATVKNEDIGFVEEKMPVSVKVDTFNFQKYGILSGKVVVISPNSVEDEHLGNVYDVYIKPVQTQLEVEGKPQELRVGMTTTNEIKIGKRRIIEFFIYPLIKYMDESIKVK